MKNSTLSERLQFLMDIKKIYQQRDFAKYVGINEDQISKWMRGSGGIGPKNAKKICQKFQTIDPHWLRTGEGEPFPEKNAGNNIIQQTGSRTAQAVQNGNIISQEGKGHHPHEILPHFPNRSMQELAEWINMQDDGINYWEILKGKLAQEFPEFRSWLKKRTATAAGQRNENISVNDK